jgi:hypothetical protein
MPAQFTTYTNLKWQIADGECFRVPVSFSHRGAGVPHYKAMTREMRDWLRNKSCKGLWTYRSNWNLDNDAYEEENRFVLQRAGWSKPPQRTEMLRDIYFFTDENTAFQFKLMFG